MTQNGNSKNPVHGLWALTNRELKKWYKNPILLLMTTIVQPIIWLGLFGHAMNLGNLFTSNTITIPTNLGIPPQALAQLQEYLAGAPTQLLKQAFGTDSYISYLSVGMLSFIVLFTCMFSGMSIVWDRRLGFLNKVLSTPVARSSIILSKILNTVIRALIQAGVVLIIAYFIGPLVFGAAFTPINLLGVFAALFLLSTGLSSIFIFIAIRSTRMETQMAVMNLLNLPLLFTSNAMFPLKFMPDWLQDIAQYNPISWATDASRQLIINSSIDMTKLIQDFTYLGVFAIVFAGMGILLSWRYLSK